MSTKELDNYSLPDFEEPKSFNLLDEMIDVIDTAEDQGVFPVLPGNFDEARVNQILDSRRCTVWTRLYLLGYIENEHGAESYLDNAQLLILRRAIRAFQADANLKVDGWVGSKTWDALEELLSFEKQINLERWMKAGSLSANALLLKAVRARLLVLGFFDFGIASDDKGVLEALARFRLLAVIVGLLPQSSGDSEEQEVVGKLFDQNAISYSLGTLKLSSIRNYEGAIARFMIQNAKVELWLHGYNVRPNNDADGLKLEKGYIKRFEFERRESDLFVAMSAHLQNLGCSKSKANKLTKTCEQKEQLINGFKWLFGNLFFDDNTPVATSERVQNSFYSVNKIALSNGEIQSDEEASDILYNTILDSKENDQKEIWNYVKRIGSRLWDGIKRAWRFLKTLFKKVARRLTNWIRNLARLAFKFGINVYTGIKRVVGAIRYICCRTYPGSTPMNSIEREAGFDYTIYIHQAADQQKVDEAFSRFQQQATIFNVGIEFLFVVVKSIIATVKRASQGIAGWFEFILSLVKIYRQYRSLRSILMDLDVA